MPMDFPDMDSLRRAASVHRFREPNDGEAEAQYRHALADHVASIDFVESCEIRNKVGWDKFSDRQNRDMLTRKLGAGVMFDLFAGREPDTSR